MSYECLIKHSLVLEAVLNFLGAGTTAVCIRAARSVPINGRLRTLGAQPT